MTPTPAAPPLLTADEFADRFSSDPLVELIDGVVERLPMPGSPHGYVALNAGGLVRQHVRASGLGRVFGCDTFVRTGTAPDRVRGADVSAQSYARLPKGEPLPKVLDRPERVMEVVSPSDRPGRPADKIREYLAAGVVVVVVLDPTAESAAVYRPDERPQTRHNGDDLALPDVLPGFAVPVAAFFE
jgi:Uma2 family endonuclease